MTTWFSADAHLGHKNISIYCPDRPGDGNTDKMNDIIINNWNSCVMPDDDVYFLGDMMMGQSIYWEGLLNRLQGNIHLIVGNHDKKFRKQEYVANRMVWIKEDYILKVTDPLSSNRKSQQIVLHHYPKLTWENADRGAWHFHGHSHGSVDHLNQDSTRIDVGLDSEHGRYFPRSYEELARVMKKRIYEPVDHHGDPSRKL